MSNANGHSGIPVGPPVTGEDFFDRHEEMEELLRLLRDGAHVSLTAPRRIGKTSLLLEAEKGLGGSFAFLYVDLEACISEADVVVKLAVRAREHRDLGEKFLDGLQSALASFRGIVGEISKGDFRLKLREALVADWRVQADGILDRLAAVGKPVVVCLDEFPVLLSSLLYNKNQKITPETIDRGRVFLNWLREATIRCRGSLRFVVAGSIGLEPLLSRAGTSETMTTFTPLAIGPWERRSALEFVTDRARRAGIHLGQDAGERLVDRLGFLIPHHVALFLHHLCADARRRHAETCNADDVDRVYDQHMLSPHGHVDLATYEDRLKRVIPPETLRAALELLTETAVAGRLSSAAALAILDAQGFERAQATDALRFLLGVFEHDGYLKRAGDEFVFVSHLLRDWWRNRFGFGYVPADRR